MLFDNCERKFALSNSIGFLNFYPSEISVRTDTSPNMKWIWGGQEHMEKIEILIHLVDDLMEVT
jgi:hypothetical protein